LTGVVAKKRLSRAPRTVRVDLEFEGRSVEVSMPRKQAQLFRHDPAWCAITSERSNGKVPRGCVLAQDETGQLHIFTRKEWRELEVVE